MSWFQALKNFVEVKLGIKNLAIFSVHPRGDTTNTYNVGQINVYLGTTGEVVIAEGNQLRFNGKKLTPAQLQELGGLIGTAFKEKEIERVSEQQTESLIKDVSAKREKGFKYQNLLDFYKGKIPPKYYEI